MCFCLILVFQTCVAIHQYHGLIKLGFQASTLEWFEDNGIFFLSNASVFGCGFRPLEGNTWFALEIIHLNSSTVVWTAGSLIDTSGYFEFGKDGNVYMESQNVKVWSTNTTGEGATAMELQDSGNLVLLGEKGRVLWQSFSHPTDTLLLGQEFLEGMQLQSVPNRNNLSQYLEIMSGDLVLYAGYETPQIYWTIADDNRKTRNNISGKVHSASLMSNSWDFYDQKGALLWQFIFSNNVQPNALWAAVLGSDGSITFSNLQKGQYVTPEATAIPQGFCSLPEPCDPYYVCYMNSQCHCPSSLNSVNCNPVLNSTCNSSRSSVDLSYVGENLDYFALGFATPNLKSDIHACQKACLGNCSCLVLFFDNTSGSCFLFDQIGSLRAAEAGSAGYVSYAKGTISNGDGGPSPGRGNGNDIKFIVIIVGGSFLVIVGLIYGAFYCHRKNKILLETSEEPLEDETLLDTLAGMPVRFSYSDLHKATNNFSIKLGQGGFGSVYLGVLPDGMLLAVKQLEGIGQGMKEFRAEIGLIGSIHHVHLVQLKGFCAEGPHRLLIYEFMAKGSLDRLIFKDNEDGPMLDWDTRFNIAVGTAKGLAYLHEECEVKIIHCDIKPENVLLDDNYVAKLSDFGLAKFMDREQSLVCTQLRGTRGYLAPEWIFNHAISEKSDVYSYGMLLLEIIGGRKNSDPRQSTEKSYLPSYAFKMMEEEKLKDVLDLRLERNKNDKRVVTAVKVALWCIQEDMHLRPPMTRVVQMLEGHCPVPQPPTSNNLGSLSSTVKWGKEAITSPSGMDGYDSVAHQSAVQLSRAR
ncbi:G-type lectin S-receptor-like serine/threonine-protein kinase SD2-5 [Morella rubra]|uniref:Receptor-like serine/threonine-protein kinase n=1 Tax=Morella rubra TaxID=262757 RepID=A0A6A1W0I3_9ROSI|nr:G-type lectin S-receptor-like serine/threonine-protein kinase SD2-5 [Morella rubra]